MYANELAIFEIITSLQSALLDPSGFEVLLLDNVTLSYSQCRNLGIIDLLLHE